MRKTRPGEAGQGSRRRVRVVWSWLQWIEGTTARWDGYLEFQRRPQPGDHGERPWSQIAKLRA
jgi:hypothetical protein